MENTTPRWGVWALEIALEILAWLGPVAGKYIEKLATRLSRDRDLYEVKDYRSALDVLDARGMRTIYSKKERIRFLRDNVGSFYDYGWGMGQPFASHRVHPGRIAERRKIGSRYRSLIVFPEPQRRGDEMTLSVHRLMRNAVTGDDGWLEMEVYHKTRRVHLRVTVPRTRTVRAARLVDARRGTTQSVGVRRVADGRQQFQWSTSSPQVGDRYTLAWDW